MIAQYVSIVSIIAVNNHQDHQICVSTDIGVSGFGRETGDYVENTAYRKYFL